MLPIMLGKWRHKSVYLHIFECYIQCADPHNCKFCSTLISCPNKWSPEVAVSLWEVRLQVQASTRFCTNPNQSGVHWSPLHHKTGLYTVLYIKLYVKLMSILDINIHSTSDLSIFNVNIGKHCWYGIIERTSNRNLHLSILHPINIKMTKTDFCDVHWHVEILEVILLAHKWKQADKQYLKWDLRGCTKQLSREPPLEWNYSFPRRNTIVLGDTMQQYKAGPFCAAFCKSFKPCALRRSLWWERKYHYQNMVGICFGSWAILKTSWQIELLGCMAWCLNTSIYQALDQKYSMWSQSTNGYRVWIYGVNFIYGICRPPWEVPCKVSCIRHCHISNYSPKHQWVRLLLKAHVIWKLKKRMWEKINHFFILKNLEIFLVGKAQAVRLLDQQMWSVVCGCVSVFLSCINRVF